MNEIKDAHSNYTNALNNVMIAQEKGYYVDPQFINILTNSIQAIEEEGTIQISTSKLNDSIEIDILDSGKGIRKEDLPKILDPFFTTKEPGKGTGLGLAISYNIIKEHKGSMDFASEINKGTSAKISLPIK